LLCAGERDDGRECYRQSAVKLSTNSFRNDDITEEQTEIPRSTADIARITPDTAFVRCFVTSVLTVPVQLADWKNLECVEWDVRP